MLKFRFCIVALRVFCYCHDMKDLVSRLLRLWGPGYLQSYRIEQLCQKLLATVPSWLNLAVQMRLSRTSKISPIVVQAEITGLRVDFAELKNFRGSDALKECERRLTIRTKL